MTATVLFLGSKAIGFVCLSHLLEHVGDLDVRVVGVVHTPPRNPLLETGCDFRALCAAHGVPYLRGLEEAADACDFLVSVQYANVLSARDLARARRRGINLHMAPLPDYRGANQFTFAILNGDREFGTTLHEMTVKVDAGPILAQRRFALAPDWTVKDLYDRTREESETLFRQSIKNILDGTAIGRPQDGIDCEARHFYRKSDIDGRKRIDPAWPPDRIDRYVRAFDMPGYEPAFMEYMGRKIYLRTRWE